MTERKIVKSQARKRDFLKRKNIQAREMAWIMKGAKAYYSGSRMEYPASRKFIKGRKENVKDESKVKG